MYFPGKEKRDRDFQVKKCGMAGLTGKNGRERGIWEPYCGPSLLTDNNLQVKANYKIKFEFCPAFICEPLYSTREGEGGITRKIWWGYVAASQNPHSVDHQNLRFSLPYLWPDQKFDNLFTTVAADTGALNISFEGLLCMVSSIMMKKQLLLNNITQFKTTVQYKTHTLLRPNWPKSIPSLWPKRLKNHTLWGHKYLYSAYKGVIPPPWVTVEVGTCQKRGLS